MLDASRRCALSRFAASCCAWAGENASSGTSRAAMPLHLNRSCIEISVRGNRLQRALAVLHRKHGSGLLKGALNTESPIVMPDSLLLGLAFTVGEALSWRNVLPAFGG